jgi:streptogramin lyase
MRTRIVWSLIGASVALLLVLGTVGFLIQGGTLTGYRFPGAQHSPGQPSPTPVVVPTPTAGVPALPPLPASPPGIVIEPPPNVVATPSPDPSAARFRELAIPKPGGTPYAIVIGSDGAVWFTEAECTSGIGRLSSAGTWQHWSITGNCESQPLAITKGPDGNLWFADVWSAYGRVKPSGEITRFSMPEASYPSGITTGPDGNLWLTVASPQSKPFIAKVATNGTELAEYPLPSTAGEPRGIVSGPDGAIWFTESAGIGRLTMSGQLTEFPLPVGNGSGSPFQIAVGPDRNIWFVEYMPEGDGRVGRMTPDGGLSEFATPGLGGLQWITAGPDQALWFTAAHSNTIGRIALNGSVTSFPVPSYRSQPVGIMTGPDGNIWFTEAPGDTTGKIGIFALNG